jgi:hypothetical protein
MHSFPLSETLAETKTCKHCGGVFPITDKDLEFYDKVSPVFSGKKYGIPTPTLCPDCRQQRRLSFRNERKLYKRKCDATEREIISIYSPDKPFKVSSRFLLERSVGPAFLWPRFRFYPAVFRTVRGIGGSSAENQFGRIGKRRFPVRKFRLI